MQKLRYTLTKNEMIVPVIVGISHKDAKTRARQGLPNVAPVTVRAEIDTGSNTTAVAPHVFGRLGLAPMLAGSSQTASGSVAVNVYLASLRVFDASGAAMLTVHDLLVSELTRTLPNVDVLIGMDVLLDCKLLLDGPGHKFTLRF